MARMTPCARTGMAVHLPASLRPQMRRAPVNALTVLGAQKSAERRVLASAASLSLTFPVSGTAAHADSPAGPFTGTGDVSGDPSTSGGSVTSIHSPEELYQILADNRDKLVCLMCKATGCRPCKMFARKYKRLAASFDDCIFLEVTGDENNALRKMMIQMNVRVTPTFRIYRESECVKTTTGVDADKLKTALNECLAGEAGEADL